MKEGRKILKKRAKPKTKQEVKKKQSASIKVKNETVNQ